MSEQYVERDFLFVENEESQIIEVTEASPGPKGDTGAQGPKGDTGNAATITVGGTTTVEYGTSAAVTNSGTTGAAVLEFTLPAGPTGPQGPPGRDGLTTSFAYEQITPSSSWAINHNMNFFPNVTVVDSAGSDVVGSISYVNQDNLVITFSAPFGGKAYLS